MTMIKSVMILLSLTAIQACSRDESSSDVKSNYPPTYSWENACRDSAEFRVCQRIGGGNRAELAVEYKGVLKDSQSISIFVKLNGREGVFMMERAGGVQYIVLANGSLSCIWGQTSNTWECSKPEQKMLDIFYYARPDYHRLNAWDVELAVVNERGQWDSRFGANYKFRFEP